MGRSAHGERPAGMQESRRTQREIRHRASVDGSQNRHYGQEGGFGVEERKGIGGAALMLEHEDAKALVRQGQEAGFLTHEEIALAFNELDLDPVQLDEFYQALEELHIDVVDAAGEEQEVELEPEAREMSTDALQLFLKDIGKVPLLTAVEEVEQIRRSAQAPISLEKPVGDEEESEFGHFLADENVALPDEAAETTLRRETLRRILGSLSLRERRVLELRYGLDGQHPRTLDEVGRTFNVTRERVRQIENQCLKKLQALAESKALREVA